MCHGCHCDGLRDHTVASTPVALHGGPFPPHGTSPSTSSVPSYDLARVTECREGFVQPWFVIGCYNLEQNVHDSVHVTLKQIKISIIFILPGSW